MRNFFRRKPEKTNPDASNQQNNSEGNSSVSFGEDHPYFKNGTPISASDILKSEELHKKFPKLSIWLGKYPCVTGIGLYNGCTDLLKIYCFEKIHLDNSYHEFRQFALKNQINEGFNLVLKYEKSVNNFKVDVGTAFTDPPFDDLTHLIEAHEYWREARQQDFAAQLIKFEVNELVLKKYMDLKQATVHLVSLLAAIDAITLNSIPYISFSKLNISKEAIIQSDSLLKQLENLASKYAQRSIQSIQRIDDVRAKFDFALNSPTGSVNDKNDANQVIREREQLQLQAFKQMLAKQYISPSANSTANLYDSQNHYLPSSADSSFFFDFISHPKCITYQFFKEYDINPCSETYRKLVSRVIETFSLKGEEATLTTYLCSLAFAQQIAPEIYFQLLESNHLIITHSNNNKIESEPKTEKSELDESHKTDISNEPFSTEIANKSTPKSTENISPLTEPKEETSQNSPTPNIDLPVETSQAAPEPSSELSIESNTASNTSTEVSVQENTPKEDLIHENETQETTTEQNALENNDQKTLEASPESKSETLTSPQVESNQTSTEETNFLSSDNADEATLERMQSVGFDVFIAADPISTLRAISNNMNAEYSTEGSVKYIIDCLKMITPKWKEILKFSVDCSIQEYLPPKLRSIRYVISEIVSL